MIMEEMLRAAAEKSSELYVNHFEHTYDHENQHEFSPQFEKKTQKLKQKAKHPFFNHAWTRAVAAVLCVCVVSFALCMSIEPIRAELVKIFLVYHGKYVDVVCQSEEEPPTSIEEYREPMLQLAGTEREVKSGQWWYAVKYTRDDMIEMIYRQHTMTTSVMLNNEDCVITDVEINGNVGKFFEYEDEPESMLLAWHDNEYSYIITVYSSDIDKELILSIAESVR